MGRVREEKKSVDAGARKGRKVAKHCFTMFCGSGGSKSTHAKLYAVVARSTCDVRSTSGSSDSDVEKVDTAVAQSMFPSQHLQKKHHVRSTFGS